MKIMKKIICVMIILIQVAFVIASASDIKELIATKTETPVYIDNHLLKSDNPIVNINGVTYVPIRDAFESLGSEVNWTKGGYVFVYTQNQYDEGETSSNIKYHYYKKQINFDENVLKEKYGYEVMLDGACSPERVETLSKMGVKGFILGTSALFGKGKPYKELLDGLRAL